MKKALIFLLALWLCGVMALILIFTDYEPVKPDMVAVNDELMSGDAPLSELLQREYERMEAQRAARDINIKIFLILYTGAVALSGLILLIYCEKSILKPFRRLQGFARRIAAGDFDIPLEMDKSNLFGAFTESFDLMREELKKARENERAADRSKKELVASLSHDIKTPVASIKATVELMQVSASDQSEKKRLMQIEAKAEQINALITDMFHATLHELEVLGVNTAEVHSTVIYGLIKNADYKNKAKSFSIPNCIILTDTLRLQQTLDNIIGNSYKYADTEIEIHSYFEEDFLVLDLSDFGAGADEDDLPFLVNKFYRGKDTETKSGYGLGLYISKSLLEQMSGDLQCENYENGFKVKIFLKLAGKDGINE
ncbi:MAG: HAMP domain-containing histidine kinase [Oscillospiraceae bacterium]|nr:HAMP domain-containing histidine kinase [Oscillospiraceae bacterium]